MASQNSPLNCTSIDLELEAIKRFRSLAPFLSPECRVFRELNGCSTILCLDFAACPQDLQIYKEEWQEFAKLLLHSSHYLGLANSLVFKNGKRIVSWVSIPQSL
ncbi:MAG: hypothetical protein QNJ70_20525 [Xenococcaceae cyanobacterium MO_207.B15]|nr:hypothetical protein [Xenococcaceae cyanobacterium MO_207.B15]